MSEAQKRVIDQEILGAELAGIALSTEDRERVTAIQQRLSELSTKFSNNVLDATKAFQRVVTDKAEVDGLPESALELAAQTAASKGHEGATVEAGPWVFTLDIPSYMPVMLHAKNRGLREELYREYLTRASSGETDNTPNIEEILQLRQEKSKLLGYDNFAEVSMARKMATLEKAGTLMEELRQVSYDAAVQDLKDVKEFAKAQGADHELRQWDITFWAERLKEEKYSVNDEVLRPYFALPSVMDDGKPIAYFYLDPYSRPSEKRGGAWMDEVVGL